MVRSLSLSIMAATAILAFSVERAVADTPASNCIKPTAAHADRTGNKGWLTNICDAHVAVVYGFDTKYDGTRKTMPWCIYENDHGNEFAAGAYGHILESGERLGVGSAFQQGVRFRVQWAACRIDTSANNPVFFLIESPFFDFDPACGFACL